MRASTLDALVPTSSLRVSGRHEVIASQDPKAIEQYAPYDIVLDGVGGPALGVALASLAKSGACVVYGATAAPQVTFDAARFYATGGATLHGFTSSFERPPASPSRA